MTESHDQHAPSAAFRASLEAQLVDTYRRELMSPPPSSVAPTRRRSRLRAAFTLAVGLLLGFGVEFAAGQVEDSKQRNDIVAMLTSKRQLSAMKLELAREERARAQRQFEAGVISQATLMSADASVRAAESELVRADYDLEEARATAAMPRDELCAPLVKGRDFVEERLRLEQQLVNLRMAAASQAYQEAERRMRAGVITQNELMQRQLEREQAVSELRILMEKTQLRRDCLSKKLAPDDLERRVQQAVLVEDLERAKRDLDLALSRLAVAEKQLKAGIISALEAKRMELDMLEQQQTIEKLRALLQALAGKKK